MKKPWWFLRDNRNYILNSDKTKFRMALDAAIQEDSHSRDEFFSLGKPARDRIACELFEEFGREIINDLGSAQSRTAMEEAIMTLMKVILAELAMTFSIETLKGPRLA